MLRRLFPRAGKEMPTAPSVGGVPARLPAGVRVYAIGDIHGRLDLLQAVERQIVEDAAAGAPDLERIVVYIGDYVDRGFESRRVIEHLITRPLPGFRPVYLLGNHDIWLRDFARGVDVADSWLRFGGDATLFSYGVPLDLQRPEAERYQLAQARLQEKIPALAPRLPRRAGARLRPRRLLLLPRRHPAGRAARGAGPGGPGLDPGAVPVLERRRRQGHRPRPHGRGAPGRAPRTASASTPAPAGPTGSPASSSRARAGGSSRPARPAGLPDRAPPA